MSDASARQVLPSAAVVVAGGSGERFGHAQGKQLFPLSGRPVLWWAVNGCASAESVSAIVLVCPAERRDEFTHAIDGALPAGVSLTVAASGATRQQSVASGLDAVPAGSSVVVIHDGARPLVTGPMVDSLISILAQRTDADGVIVGHPSVDTLKVVDGDVVTQTPERARYWQVQTPQVFRREALVSAHASAAREGFIGTDDASLVERAGGRVVVSAGPRDNIKVTVAEDIAFAEAAIERRRGE